MEAVAHVGLTRRNFVRGIVGAASLAAAGPLLSSCGSSSGGPDSGPAVGGSWDEITAKAREEGQLTVYWNSVLKPIEAQVKSALQETFGISLSLHHGRAPDEIQKILAEARARKPVADIFVGGHDSAFAVKDYLAPVGNLPNAPAVVNPVLKKNATGVPVCVFPYGILVNTNILKDAEIPKSWNDLLNPRYRDQIIMDDPRVPGGGVVFFAAANDTFGPLYQQQLQRQGVSINRLLTGNEDAVARGDRPIYLPYILGHDVSHHGQPVRSVIPVEGVPWTSYEAVPVKIASHPNAARVFANYLVSVEGQKLLASTGVTPARPDVAPPAGVPALADLKLMSRGPLEDDQNKYVQEAERLYS